LFVLLFGKNVLSLQKEFMDTVILKIDSNKKDFFLNLMHEFSFIKDVETVSESESEQYRLAVEQSEQDFKDGNFKTHNDLKAEIVSWRRK